MHRRGGKRIRMDDPPPEYDNPMTPSTPAPAPVPEYTPTYTASHDSSGEYGSAAGEETPAPPEPEAEPDAEPEDEELPPPTPPPTKRVTRSKGKVVGRLAESPPPPLPKRGRGRGRGRGARNHPPSPPPQAYSPPPFPAPGDLDTSLYSVLRYNKTTINNVVDLWIEQYKNNKESALVQLMQFFINASGCKGKITPDMASMEHHLIIRKMTQEFDEESGEYPLIMTGTTWKKFKVNLCEFIQTLVKMCQYSIIYDQYLMDNIISLLTGLSDSQVRAFRHTATLAVMKLMTALVDVALLTSVNCDNCLRQYEAERLKARDKRATDRLELLVTKRQELEENMEEIKNMLSYMFKSVFVHRYRDTLPEIRAITMAEIGIWMEKFPAHFLDDLYLKYIGWTLHDKVGEVRLKCLQALQPLYQCEDLKGKLELFTSKFKDRIVAMSLDKEYEVAVHAVRLVISILKMHPDVLTDKDCENVYELVYSSHRLVAQAAGEFLNVRLFRLEEDAPQQRSRRGKKRLPNTPLIRDLVQFFIESELHEHGAYLVDSLIESNPMMKDWECMTDLLLEEAGPGEEALDNRQESSLIELMVCCVRQASTGEPPVGRGSQRKHHHTLSKEQNKVVMDDRQKLTVHFIPTLPQLLQKFGADPEKLTNLVSIPQYFDLEVYTAHRQEQNLTELLNKLRDMVSVQTEPEVLEMCGRTLEFLCSDTAAVYTRCNVARSTIADLCVNRYKEAADEYRNLIAGGEEPDPDEIFSVTNWTRKVSIMYMCHNLNNTNIWDSLFEDLPKCVKETDMPAEALVYALRSCFYSLMWSLYELEERLASGADVSAPTAVLRERLHGYIAQCRQIVADGATTQLKEEAYVSICDLLVFFAEHLASVHYRNTSAIAELVYEPDNDMCDLLNSFIQQFVFIQQNYDGQDERRIEELHKRRNFLAAYCKLIVYNVAPIRRAADVFKYYIKCYNDYGDIIKATVSKAREMSKLNCALTMVLAMQANFTDVLNQQPAGQPVPRNLQEFLDLKELAKRFSVMFGLDAVKNREAITALHRAGISFAVLDSGPTPAGSPPRNLHFLEILSEFTNKLIKQDRRVVLKFLDARVASGVAWGDEWQPLLNYRNSLVQADGPEERAPATRRAYTRRRQPEDEEGAEENPESEGEAHGLHPSPARRRPKRPRLGKLAVEVTPAKYPTRRKRPLMSPSTSPSPDIESPGVKSPEARRRRTEWESMERDEQIRREHSVATPTSPESSVRSAQRLVVQAEVYGGNEDTSPLREDSVVAPASPQSSAHSDQHSVVQLINEDTLREDSVVASASPQSSAHSDQHSVVQLINEDTLREDSVVASASPQSSAHSDQHLVVQLINEDTLREDSVVASASPQSSAHSDQQSVVQLINEDTFRRADSVVTHSSSESSVQSAQRSPLRAPVQRNNEDASPSGSSPELSGYSARRIMAQDDARRDSVNSYRSSNSSPTQPAQYVTVEADVHRGATQSSHSFSPREGSALSPAAYYRRNIRAFSPASNFENVSSSSSS